MSYELFLEPEVHAARRALPGKVRQQIRRAIDALSDNPRPSNSHDLDTAGVTLPSGVEIRRIRLERWRILYSNPKSFVHARQREQGFGGAAPERKSFPHFINPKGLLYAVCDGEAWVWVLGIRRRPPYDYDDLPDLVGRLPGA